MLVEKGLLQITDRKRHGKPVYALTDNGKLRPGFCSRVSHFRVPPSVAGFRAGVEDEGVIDPFFGGAGLGPERGRQLGFGVPVAAGKVDPDSPLVG